jgi:hypothetical protein
MKTIISWLFCVALILPALAMGQALGPNRVSVTTSIHLNTDLNVETLKADVVDAGTLQVTGNAAVDGNLSAGGTFGVTGAASFTGDVSANYVLMGDAGMNNAIVTGTLGVTGDLSANYVLVGDAGVNNLVATGNATLGSMAVSGTAEIAALDAGVAASGTALVRPLSARLAEEANVRDFGATGDGTTDDSAAFAAAISAVTARDGGTIYVPPGIYRTNLTISQSSVHLRGAGYTRDTGAATSGGTMLKYHTNTLPVIQIGDGTIDTRGVEVDHMTIQGGNNAAGHGVYVVGARMVSLHHMQVISSGGDGIKIASSATKATSFVNLSDMYIGFNGSVLGTSAANLRATYGASGVTAVRLVNTNIQTGGAVWGLINDGVSLDLSNTWLDVANGYGVFMDKTGSTYPYLLGSSNVHIDSTAQTDTLVTFTSGVTATHSQARRFISAGISVDGVALWNDTTTENMVGPHGALTFAVSAPALLSSGCLSGMLAWDSSNLYVCSGAANTWTEAPLTLFHTTVTHAALDLASVASGSCSAQTTEVATGAVLGTDTCRVAAGVALQGLMPQCEVSANNEVKWSLCNQTGGAIDLASTTYTIQVLR